MQLKDPQGNVLHDRDPIIVFPDHTGTFKFNVEKTKIVQPWADPNKANAWSPSELQTTNVVPRVANCRPAITQTYWPFNMENEDKAKLAPVKPVAAQTPDADASASQPPAALDAADAPAVAGAVSAGWEKKRQKQKRDERSLLVLWLNEWVRAKEQEAKEVDDFSYQSRTSQTRGAEHVYFNPITHQLQWPPPDQPPGLPPPWMCTIDPVSDRPYFYVAGVTPAIVEWDYPDPDDWKFYPYGEGATGDWAAMKNVRPGPSQGHIFYASAERVALKTLRKRNLEKRVKAGELSPAAAMGELAADIKSHAQKVWSGWGRGRGVRLSSFLLFGANNHLALGLA